jgi:16S rRNA (guanine527-N7)-methyltransferase
MPRTPGPPGQTDPSRERVLQAAILELGLHLDPSQAGRLLGYLDLLHKWNATYNLTAVRDPDAMLVQHLIDSLAVIPPLQRRIRLDTARIADVGSGAGIPGIPLAIALPGARVTLVEPVGKKSAFQRQCQAELALTNVIIYNGRAEALTELQDLIVCRAFASLADFVEASAAMTGPATILAAMKGQRPDAEVAALPPGLSAEVVPIVVPGMAASRHLVLIRRAAS